MAPNFEHFHQEWVGGTRKTFRETPDKINPITSSSATASDMEGLVNDSLASRHPATMDRWSQSLATSCIISDSYTSYVFTIRQGVYWQRPQCAIEPGFEWLGKEVELTAHDFVFYLDMALHEEVIAPHLKAYLEDVESYRAIDDYTFEVRWAKRDYSSLSTVMSLSPLPRHIYTFNPDGSPMNPDLIGVTFNKHWFDEKLQMVGVGPYVLTEYTPDRIVSFERNPGLLGEK